MFSAESFLHLLQIMQALIHPSLPSSIWIPPYSLWQFSFWKYSGCAFGMLSCALHSSNLGVGMEFLAEVYFFLLTVQKRWLVWEWFFAFPSQEIQKISLDKNFLLQCGNLPICCRHQFYGNPSFLIFWNWESEREVFHFPVLHAKEAE